MAERIGGMDAAEIAEAFSMAKEQVAGAVQQARQRLEIDRRMRENPWAVLGVAAGAGFLLGGGLWPLLRPLVRAAGRAALAPSNLLAIGAALGALRAAGAEEEAEEEEPVTEEPVPTAH